MTAHAGEVHALCGENGAGKSTLMKILAGAITDYDGRDRPRRPAGRVRRARATPRTPGIRIIYQELNLVPELTVAANIFLGRERTRGLGWLDDRAMEAEARRLFERLGTPISPRARVGDLRIGDQQMVEIAKALAFDAAILIMDEPTSALSDAEVARLFRVIDDLRKAGHDRPLHLAQDERGLHPGRPRDGPPRRPVRRHAPRGPRPTPAQVVRWMVGREIAALHYRAARRSPGRAMLEVEDLVAAQPARERPAALGGLTFQVHAGEVLGVAGLLGAGRTELLEALFGASPSPPDGHDPPRRPARPVPQPGRGDRRRASRW